MIDEVVRSIIDAEDEAKRRVTEAEQKAAQIVAEAEQRAEEIRRSASDKGKARFQAEMAQAEADAAQLAAERLRKLNEQTDKETAALEQNTDGAVKLILGSL